MGRADLLNEISNIHGHLINLCTVILLDISENSNVITLHKINSHTFTAITPTPTNPVDIQLTVVGKVIIDDQGHLLDV
jgi:hypothetical protein